MNIKVDTEHLYRLGETNVQLTERMHNNMESLEMQILFLSDKWRGLVGNEFVSKIIYIKQEFQDIEYFLQKYSEIMMDLAKKYDEQEEKLASRIMNI